MPGAGSENWLCVERELKLLPVEDELVVGILPLQNLLGRGVVAAWWMVCPTLAD